MSDAARWIDTVGFCLLFASTQKIELPSLFEAVKGRRFAHIDDWDAEAERVWGWKNELPATRRAYYGKALTGKPIFISLKMLPYVLAFAAPDNVSKEFKRGRLSVEAKRVYDTLTGLGPTPTMALRAATGLENARYHRALDELQRLMIVLPVGATTEQSAWPSQIFELMARWFPRQVARAENIDAPAARRTVVRQYMRTVVACKIPMILRVFGMPRDQVSAAVNALCTRHILKQAGDWILANGS